VIDLKAARAAPDAFRAALARKGAAAELDALLAADERWRVLVPRVDELRSRTKLSGKPTPEQLEELRQVKAELKAAEEELAAAEAERDTALAPVPNPPHESAPDGETEDDAVEVRRSGEPPMLETPREHTEIGRFEMERAARVSGARFGYLVGDSIYTLAFVYVVLVLPFAYRAIDNSLSTIDVVTLSEAARSLGAGWGTVITRVVVPNIGPGLLSAAFVSVALVLGEYTIASLTNYENLQVVINFLGKSAARTSVAASLAVLVFVFVLLMALSYVGRGRRGAERS